MVNRICSTRWRHKNPNKTQRIASFRATAVRNWIYFVCFQSDRLKSWEWNTLRQHANAPPVCENRYLYPFQSYSLETEKLMSSLRYQLYFWFFCFNLAKSKREVEYSIFGVVFFRIREKLFVNFQNISSYFSAICKRRIMKNTLSCSSWWELQICLLTYREKFTEKRVTRLNVIWRAPYGARSGPLWRNGVKR